MFFTCDDVSMKYLDHLKKLEEIKKWYPHFKVTCFVIAENLEQPLIDWLRQDWIEVAVHGYSHEGIPECERSDKEERIKKALKILEPLLPEKFGFRAPGFQMTATTYPILKKLGFWYVAHQAHVQILKNIKNYEEDKIINTHIYDKLELDFIRPEFKFISEAIK